MDNKVFYRNFQFDRTKLDKETRSIELSLSSNTPVKQYWETMILLHGKANVDLSQLNSALLSHDASKIIGKYENKQLKKDQLRATLIFDDDELGNFAMAKVESGSLQGASVAFTVQKFKRLEEGEESEGYKGPIYIATKWTPYEASLTPIPADSTVGIGRDLSQSLDGIEIEYSENHINQTREDKDMDEKEVKTLIEQTVKDMVPEIVKAAVPEVRSIMEEEAKPRMKIETEVLQDLLGRAGAISLELKSKVSDMAVVEGKTEQEITKVILDAATGDTDADDHGDGSDDGTGTRDTKKAKAHATIGSFEQVEDDAFFSGLSKPAMFPM